MTPDHIDISSAAAEPAACYYAVVPDTTAPAWPRLLLPLLAAYAAAAAGNALYLLRRHRESWAAVPWLWILVPTENEPASMRGPSASTS